MILYLSIILGGGFLIALFNSLLWVDTWAACFLITYAGIIIEIAIDAITAAVCRGLPERWFPHDGKIFKVSVKEKRFYEKLRIRKWKEKIPEIGRLTGFRKNRVEDPKSLEYVERFLLEIRYGQVVHFVSLFSGFLLLLFLFFPFGYFSIALPICLVNFGLHLLPIFTLRYNSYKLERLYEANKKHADRVGRVNNSSMLNA